MKKRMFYALCALVLIADLLSGTGCAAGTTKTDTGKLCIVATIWPPYDFACRVCGELAEITQLLPAGAESHSYEPTPSDMILLEDCDLFLYGGGASDSWCDSLLKSEPDKARLAMLDVVEARVEEPVAGMQSGGEEEEEDGEYDEHVWTSPKNAMLIVEAIRDRVCELDPANAEAYRANAAAYLAELAQLDVDFAQAVAAGSRKTVVFGDRFPFLYFVKAYGLTYYAAFPGCASETEPGAATVAFLIEKVRDEDIPVVFYIENSNRKTADAVCEATGAEALQFHSCHNLTRAERDAGLDYLSLMRQNLENLKEALA